MPLSPAFQDLVKAHAAEKFSPSTFVPGVSSIPPSGKVFDAAELMGGVEAVLDGWWTEGNFARAFEERFAQLLGRSFCALVNSGSSANLVAFAALTSHKLGERRIKPGDEVITVAAGFPTTIAPLIQYGCIPVFVDIDIATYNIRFEELEQARSDKTRAVMIAHTLGNPFPAKEIADWCKQHGYWLIEDTCDALGGTYQDQALGTFGDVATFSFYPAHHITMGEGGAVATNDAFLNKIIRSFRDWGRDCWCPPGHDNTCGIRFEWKLGGLPKGYDHKYIYSEFGYNLKVTDMQAAIGLAQLDKLPAFTEARKRNHAELCRLLEPVAHLIRLPKPTPGSDPSWFGFLISVMPNAPFTRAELLQRLNEKKIGTRLLFSGNILKQPMFMAYKPPHRVVGDLATTEEVLTQTFWVGCYPGLSSAHLTFMAETVIEFCRERGGV